MIPIHALLHPVLEWFKPGSQLRRYRVAPRQHPFLFRRHLMQAIACELRKTGLVMTGKPLHDSETAL